MPRCIGVDVSYEYLQDTMFGDILWPPLTVLMYYNCVSDVKAMLSCVCRSYAKLWQMEQPLWHMMCCLNLVIIVLIIMDGRHNITDHTTTTENFSVVGREDTNLARTIKESIYIRVNNTSLNVNIGNYDLPYIWNEALFNTSKLQITAPFAMIGYPINLLGITSAYMVHHSVA